jgi:hypothetical protein
VKRQVNGEEGKVGSAGEPVSEPVDAIGSRERPRPRAAP